MKSRFAKMLAVLLTLCMVMGCLTGCESLDYREAVQHYNNRRYEKAAELFYELGDYQDSKALFNDSHYWAAMELMEAGDYASAWPRFHKLAGYKDSADRAVECKYQMAISAFEAEEYNTAERYFLESPEYRQTPEYLRQLNWQKLYDYILSRGMESGGCFVLTQAVGERTVNFIADMTAPQQLQMAVTWEKNMGYSFRDELVLTLPRESTEAAFTACSGFTMDFGDGQIGSEQTGSGKVDLSGYAAGTELVLDSFSLTGTDNLGQPLNSQDPADCSMDKAMTQNMAAIMEAIPIMLAQAGTEPIF